jgi:3-oxoacyl-(acyl-carrier-protein) synthase
MLDVAITGTGVVSALGCGADRFHQAMMAGETAIREAPWHNGEEGAAELVGDRARFQSARLDG